MSDGGVFVSKTEQVCFQILEDYRSGRLSRKAAAERLGVSERAVTRRAAKVRLSGISGVKHGNYRRRPVNKTSDSLKDEALRLVREVYYDFNTSHCHEMLRLNHDMSISYMTLLGWCRSAGLSRRKRRRPSKARLSRERMANEGLMLQMDGSHHKWNGQDEWCLISLIDDATSDVPFARLFADGETTWNCMTALRAVIEKLGIPSYIYADKAGWAGGGSDKRANFTQFVRACEELGISVIAAHSPQAKGRVERSFSTTQDRLIPELRLYGITSLLDCNRYLEQCFLPQWRERYVVEPRAATTRYRRVPAHINLHDVFCLKYHRLVANDNAVSYGNQRYKILDRHLGSLRQKEVTVHEYQDGSVGLFYGHLRLTTELIVPPKRRWSDRAG